MVTFAPLAAVPNGTLRVAALQSVYSEVSINFTTEAALYWVASVLKAGELNPNQAAQLFSRNTDTFVLQVTQDIAVSHDPDGWTVPAYNDNEYVVHVGFGLKIRDWVYWAYSVLCTPRLRVAVAAGSYELVRSDGAEQVGDPVYLVDMSQWCMAMGYPYALHFDAQGDGVLRRL